MRPKKPPRVRLVSKLSFREEDRPLPRTPGTRLSDSQRAAVPGLLKAGWKPEELADLYRVTLQEVLQLAEAKTRKPPKVLTQEERKEARLLWSQGLSQKKLAEKFGVNQSTISHILGKGKK
jgi:DNA invertase Pin-like site-specific DNA recombinase